jgi:hypothetical protein
MLIGLVIDIEKQRRTSESKAIVAWVIVGIHHCEVQAFSNIDKSDALTLFSRDDYLLLALARYF